MFRVEVNGRAVRLHEAVAESVRFLSACKLPLIAGMGGDIAAVRKSILIAEKLRGVIDHLASDETMRNLDVMQRNGWMVVSPGEVSRSCDLLLQVGLLAGMIRIPEAASKITIQPEAVPMI